MTEQPPICDYEGSDYQDSFWEKGGRKYEDACEEVALKRLLPESGKLMLELGAGAGRNTKRYKGYEKVVLLDYSRTQLEQARDRLGLDGPYRFVAADVYKLPFVPGLFDGATMIRTLHHMSEPLLALQQVRKVLQNNAAFILEYANKQNLKAMLRYLVGKQDWSPYTLDAVEFEALNFDFHPKAIRCWLKEAGFESGRQLTVSHYRMALLKKLVPHKLLVWMDSIAQLSGNLWQFSPSVFVKNTAVGETETAKEGDFFACPTCGLPVQDDDTEIQCSCGKTYPVRDGIYDFRIN